MNTEQRLMARAIQLAEKGRYSTQPNPRVGCVIVKHGKIIGEGFHRRAGEGHAEINALKQAGEAAADSDVYVTLEPCSHQGRTPPCTEALIKAGVKRVFVAMVDPNPLVSGQGLSRLRANGIETSVGLQTTPAQTLNRGYIKRMQCSRPFVSLKIACSLDGRIAMRSGESAWITSKAARKDVHRMRLESCAIITGINTVLADDPSFTVRLGPKDIEASYYLTDRQPVRVVLDRLARLPKNAKICHQAGQTWQLIGESMSDNVEYVANRCEALGLKNNKLDLNALLALLSEQEMNNVLIEAGGTLAASFIESGLVDELIAFQSPDIMGSSAQAMIKLPEILKMSEKLSFEYQEIRKIGRDLKLTLSPSR